MGKVEVQFDKREITEVLFCALLMSAVDKEIHVKEWEVIQIFIKRYWDNEFGSFKDLEKMIIKELGRLLKDSEKLDARLDHLFSWLGEKLSQNKKQIVLDLVSQVMAADEKLLLSESDLFAKFLKAFGVQKST